MSGYTNEAKAEEAGQLLASKLFDARMGADRKDAKSPVRNMPVALSEREVVTLCKAAFELGVQCAISAMHKAEGGGES